MRDAALDASRDSLGLRGKRALVRAGPAENP
jgi:hypothetical protein